MNPGIVPTLMAAILATACADGGRATDAVGPRLYLWVHGPDDLVPHQFNSDKAGGSASGLASALRSCGAARFEIETFGLAGEEVSTESSPKDEVIVDCVRLSYPRGFNANRSNSNAMKRGDRGVPVMPNP